LPADAVEVLQRAQVGTVDILVGQAEAYLLARSASDRKHRVWRAFVDRHVADRQRTVVVEHDARRQRRCGCRVVRCEVVARAIVHEGAEAACAGGLAGVGRDQLEGFRPVRRGILLRA
jgi:hypothetical protein